MIKASLTLLGLTAATFPALAQAHLHGHARPKRTPNNLAQYSATASRYPMPALTKYTNSIVEAEEVGRFRSAPSSNYVETATEFASQQVPEVEWRVVPDYYVGKNGIGHVHLKQQVHGLDLLNGDFNVNVSFV
jgi:extracellular elastinolytic metalloproteinase